MKTLVFPGVVRVDTLQSAVSFFMPTMTIFEGWNIYQSVNLELRLQVQLPAAHPDNCRSYNPPVNLNAPSDPPDRPTSALENSLLRTTQVVDFLENVSPRLFFVPHLRTRTSQRATLF